MKSIIPIFLLSLCLNVTNLAQQKTDLEEASLRGSVKKVEIFYLVTETKDGKEVLVQKPSESFSYNPQGWMTEHLGFPYQTAAYYKHDKRGRRIASEYYGNAGRETEFIYEYDKSGRIVKQTRVADIKGFRRMTLDWHVFTYDKNDNLLSQENFTSGSETPDEKVVCTYDSQNRKISETTYDRDGRIKFGNAWVFSKDGFISEIATTFIDPNGQERVSRSFFTYDDKKRMLKNETRDNEGVNKAASVEYLYDDSNLTKEERYYSGNVLFSKIVYKLDKYGNVIAKAQNLSDEAKKMFAEMARRPSQGLIPLEAGAIAALSGMFAREAYKYEYDSRGNWIKRTEYQATEFVIGQDNLDAELKPVRSQIRVISYYD